jgi:Protein of unknown function (DUF3108)
MKKLILLTFLFVGFIGFSAYSQRTAFKAGEKITYTVYYNVIGLYINAGTASFATSQTSFNNEDVFHVVGEGVTNSRYDWIFKVRDRYESYFTTAELKPVKFIRQVHEGNYKKYEEVNFDRLTNIAVTSEKAHKVPSQVQDVISSLYYARNLNYDHYKEGDKIPFNMFLDDHVYEMYVRYVGKETIKTKHGKFNAIKLKPLLIDGNAFKGGEKMTIWVSADDNHIPLRIESPLTVGKIKVDLTQYSAIKYPLTSLIATN